jgi:hypothetical protein
VLKRGDADLLVAQGGGNVLHTQRRRGAAAAAAAGTTTPTIGGDAVAATAGGDAGEDMSDEEHSPPPPQCRRIIKTTSLGGASVSTFRVTRGGAAALLMTAECGGTDSVVNPSFSNNAGTDTKHKLARNPSLSLSHTHTHTHTHAVARALGSALRLLDGRRSSISATVVIPEGRPGEGRKVSKVALNEDLQRGDVLDRMIPLERLQRIKAIGRRAALNDGSGDVAVDGEMLSLHSDVALAFVDGHGVYTRYIGS